MTKSERRQLADKICAEVDALFHHAEKSNPNGNITYLDLTRICGRIREHFKGETPSQLEQALRTALDQCHPETLITAGRKEKRTGIIALSVGGIALFWGIVYIVAYGITTKDDGWIWDEKTTDLGGPCWLSIGIPSIAVGVYLLKRNGSTKGASIGAFDVIKRGIENWVDLGA